MVQMLVDDPSWGHIFSQFGDAFDPYNKARAKVLGANYAKQVMENQETQKLIGARDAAVPLLSSDFDRRNPQPAGRDVMVPWDTTINPEAQPPQVNVPPTAEEMATWKLRRDQNNKLGELAMRMSSNPKQLMEAFYGGQAMGDVWTGGISPDKGRRDVTETALSLIGASQPGYDQAKMPLKQYEVLDPNGNRIAGGFTQNGVTDVNGNPINVPPGHTPRLVNPVAGDVNPYKNEDVYKNLAALDQKRRASGGMLPTVEDAERAGILLNQIAPVSINKDGILVREKPVPEPFGDLAKVYEAYREHRGMPPITSGPATAPAGGPTSPPDAIAGGLAGTPTPATSPAGGAAAASTIPPPIVPQPQPSLTGSPAGERVVPGDPMTLVSKFHDNPVVKAYNSALGPYQSLLSNMQVNSPQADVAIIYAIAKIMDPGSAVRDGEMVIWSKTSSLTQQLDGYLSKALAGESSMTPEVRRGLLDAARNAMQGQYAAAAPVVQGFRNIAQEQRLDPSRYIPFEQPPSIDPGLISSRAPRGPGDIAPVPGVAPRGSPTATPQQGAPAAAPSGGRTVRVNPQTGEIEVVQ
jgi:hypothetical protein